VTSDLLRVTARLVFFAALAYAPWAYGGTTVSAIETINWLLLAALVLWIVDLIFTRRKLIFPRALVWLILCLLAIGAWMVFNAAAIYDAEFAIFATVRRPMPHFAGSVDYALSAACMIRCALLFGVVLFVVDLTQDDRWLLRLWQVIGIVGGSLAFLGLLQKATGAEAIFWQTPISHSSSNFFATYYYHGNAGAFLNLVLPLTAGLAVRSFTMRPATGLRALWLTVFLLMLGAVFANTSRIGQVIAVLMLFLIGLRFGPALMRRLSGVEKRIALAGAAAVVLALLAVAQASHLELPIKRWEAFPEQISTDARWRAASVAINALPDTGFFGFGPGSFRAVFPYLNSLSNDRAGSGWRFLHEDYLQTALEWGWLGSVLWLLIFFGGMAIGLQQFRLRQTRNWSPRRRFLLPLAIIALLGVALHALADFPLQIASIQLYLATYLGVCWGSTRWNVSDDQKGNR
jgi:O-antigen ligase